MTTTNRPGGEECARCRQVFEYRQMHQVRVNGWRRPRWMCLECRQHLARLNMLAR